ncbi:haloacid dehalogenase [Neisseria arctica]|uniref:Haloacid dehalogenase n=1 Tax=Neisseria arctica TaxID=1470200 RepID=A0A0J0YUS9_9NEIS|nr:HAD family hydrolase [Neisseria arctica]KLT73854.1 haloacid dehalogenase [Neisseria arctica]UOO86957.1 HAD family hydrolase [Neisseria arctica]
MTITINPAESVLVLDLDDTLYAEFDYKLSGIKKVCSLLARLYPEYNEEILLNQIDPDSSDWLNKLASFCNLNAAEKNSLLWVYRLHNPEIQPYVCANELKALLNRFCGSAIISDGRSLSQRLKLHGLGLLHHFEHILISEAWHSEKPNPERFDFIMEQYPGKTYIYVGDNIKKDFITPKQMGWLTIGLKPSEKNIHRYPPESFSDNHQPHYWIRHINQIKEFIC